MKYKNNVISVVTEKAFDKIHPLMIKTLNRLRIEGTCHNITKGLYDNILLNKKKNQPCFLRIGNKAKMHPPTAPIPCTSAKVLAKAIRQDKEKYKASKLKRKT